MLRLYALILQISPKWVKQKQLDEIVSTDSWFCSVANVPLCLLAGTYLPASGLCMLWRERGEGEGGGRGGKEREGGGRGGRERGKEREGGGRGGEGEGGGRGGEERGEGEGRGREGAIVRMLPGNPCVAVRGSP